MAAQSGQHPVSETRTGISTEAGWRLLALGSAALGALAALVWPGVLLQGLGHPATAGTMHLWTVGAVLSGVIGLQQRAWRGWFGAGTSWRRLWPVILALHGVGLVLFVAGFLRHDSLLAYLGGHYLVPTAAVLALIQGWRAAARREAGRPRLLAVQLPGLGLAAAASLGALLVMDAHRGLYGIYTPHTITMHFTMAGFLFVLPQLWVLRLLPPDVSARGTSPSDATLRGLYGRVGLAGLGVLLVALGLGAQAGTGLFGNTTMLGAGWALLGAVTLWDGLAASGGPAAGESTAPREPLSRRAPWLLLGLLLLYSAVRTLRGAEGPESLLLAQVAVPFFLLALAVPGVLRQLLGAGTVSPTCTRAAAWRDSLWLAGALGIAAGQLAGEGLLVRTALLLWLGGLAAAWVGRERG